jgi:hypothetical protein
MQSVKMRGFIIIRKNNIIGSKYQDLGSVATPPEINLALPLGTNVEAVK